jgi:hypothetical protein
VSLPPPQVSSVTPHTFLSTPGSTLSITRTTALILPSTVSNPLQRRRPSSEWAGITHQRSVSFYHFILRVRPTKDPKWSPSVCRNSYDWRLVRSKERSSRCPVPQYPYVLFILSLPPFRRWRYGLHYSHDQRLSDAPGSLDMYFVSYACTTPIKKARSSSKTANSLPRVSLVALRSGLVRAPARYTDAIQNYSTPGHFESAPSNAQLESRYSIRCSPCGSS